MKYENFHYSFVLADDLYDVTGDTDKLEEIGLVAFRKIGNKRTRLYKATAEIPQDGYVKLPCNCDHIESVTYCGPEDWKYTSNIHEHGDIQSSINEDYIEAQKTFLDPLYLSGKLVKYREEGDYIYVNKGFGKINILYHGEQVDEDGLPEITMKEALAIAAYLGYTYWWKKFMRETNNKAAQVASEKLEREWYKRLDAARVPEYISQNEMDMILDAQSSWNLKKRGFSYKPTL